MKQIALSLLLLTTLSFTAHAYDKTQAEKFEKFYAGMDQKACAKSTLFMEATELLKLMREEKEVLVLDVRTAGENSVISVSYKDAMHVEMKDLFKPENLDKLPTDRPIVVACHSGTRGLMAVLGLKQIGFKNVQVLKGGLMALAKDNTVKNAPLK
ncbi:MAG: rhodanese-like domain-containing protein [Campylobacterales bacterium]|nr:rhodanese-like domain-containing protein [Campylobacterales bacterium]